MDFYKDDKNYGKQAADDIDMDERAYRTVYGGYYDPWGKPKPPPFPLDCLPQLLRTVVEDTSQRQGSCLAAVAMAHLATVAGAADSRVSIKVKKFDDWYEGLRLWVMLAGDPSTLKTPIINAAIKPIRAAEKAALDVWLLQKSAWDDAPKEGRGPEPIVPAYLIDDTTPEAVAKLLSTWPRGTFNPQDELSSWIGNMEKYAAGKGGSANRGFWLQAYEGGHKRQDRIGRGTIVVPNLSVSVLGGMQPDRLREMGNLTSDGLLQRFIPVMVSPGTGGVDRPPSPSLGFWASHIQRLLDEPATRFRLDDEGHAIREKAFADLRELTSITMFGGGFVTWAGKSPAMMMRLLLALHLADPATLDRGGDLIPAETARKAADLIEWVKRSAVAFYRILAGDTESDEDTKQIASFILRKQYNVLSLRHFTQHVACCKRGSEQDKLKKISALVAAGWLEPSDGKNHPIKRWKVSHSLFDYFKERQEAELDRAARAQDLLRARTGDRRADQRGL
jgi:hypothetical protein